MYYVDVYGRNSILSYETIEFNDALKIVSEFILPAQMINVYSYLEGKNPFPDIQRFKPTKFTFGHAYSNKLPPPSLEKALARDCSTCGDGYRI